MLDVVGEAPGPSGCEEPQARMLRAAPWTGLIGLALLTAASKVFQSHSVSALSLVALLGGMAFWGVALWMAPPGREELPRRPPAIPGARKIPLILALAASALCLWTMPTDEFRLPGVLLWVGAMGAWLWAWWPARETPAGAREVARGLNRALPFALGILLMIGIFFAFHRLAGVPLNPVSDHAEEMLDMADLLKGRYGIFFFRNLGIAPFHFYWTCAFVWLGLPLKYLTLKTATAVIGVLAIPAMYLAGRELGGPWLGLSSAGFLAWGKWHFSLARQGLEYTHAVLPAIVVVWALLRYMRLSDRRSALIAGLAIGVGLATYPSFRVVPLLVPLALLFRLFDRGNRGACARIVGHGLLIAATAAVVFLPIVKFSLVSDNRGFFWARSLSRLTQSEQAIRGNPLAVFAGNLWNMARAFHWKGSSTWTVILEGDPFLDVVSGGLLLAGLVLLFWNALRRQWRWVWLAPAFFLLTLPSTLSLAFPEENPSLNRAGPAIPVVFLLLAAPISYLCRTLSRQGPLLRALGFAAVIAICLASLVENYRSYFVEFAASYDRSINHALQMAEVLRRYHSEGIPYENAYLLAIPNWVDGQNIAFEIGEPDWAKEHLIPGGELPPPLDRRPLVFLYHPSDRERLDRIHAIYPGKERIVEQSHSDRVFGVYVAR